MCGAGFSSKMTVSKTVFYQIATQIGMIFLLPVTLVVEKLSWNNAQSRKQISSNLMIWFVIIYHTYVSQSKYLKLDHNQNKQIETGHGQIGREA